MDRQAIGDVATERGKRLKEAEIELQNAMQREQRLQEGAEREREKATERELKLKEAAEREREKAEREREKAEREREKATEREQMLLKLLNEQGIQVPT
jgi:ATP-dependent RNA helicase DDX46/PRP5